MYAASGALACLRGHEFDVTGYIVALVCVDATAIRARSWKWCESRKRRASERQRLPACVPNVILCPVHIYAETEWPSPRKAFGGCMFDLDKYDAESFPGGVKVYPC